MRQVEVGVLLLGLLASVGCSNRAYVEGQVTREDGTAVTNARVIARSDETGISAHGMTDGEGNFTLGVMEKSDGLPPGEYTVVIVENLGEFENPKPATIHPNYRHPTTSGLSLSLEPRERFEYDLTLKPPPGKK